MHDIKDTLATSKENMRMKAKSRKVCIKQTSVILMTYKVNIKSTVLSITIIIVVWVFLFFFVFFFFFYFGIYSEMYTLFNCVPNVQFILCTQQQQHFIMTTVYIS